MLLVSKGLVFKLIITFYIRIFIGVLFIFIILEIILVINCNIVYCILKIYEFCFLRVHFLLFNRVQCSVLLMLLSY